MNRSILPIIISIIAVNNVFCQNNVGINVAQPTEALTVDRGIVLDYKNQNTGGSLLNALKFGKATTSSQMAGISSNRSGAAGSYGLDFYTGGLKYVSIGPNGHMAINTTASANFLEVGGTVRALSLRSAGAVIAEGGNVTAAAGNIVATKGDVVATQGELKAGGKGVLMSNTGARQTIYIGTATLSLSNFAPGSTTIGSIEIPENTFTGTPVAFLGNVLNKIADYYKVLIVLEDVSATHVSMRIVNVSSSAISFTDATWQVILIGPF